MAWTNISSHSSGSWEIQDPGCWQIWYLVRTSFLVCACLSCCVLTWQSTGRGKVSQNSVKYIHIVVQPLFAFPSWNSIPIKQTLTPDYLCPYSLATTCWLSVSMNWTILGTSFDWIHTVLGFLWLVYFTQHEIVKVDCCQHVSEFLSFLMLNNILLYVHTTFGLCLFPSMDIELLSWLLWLMLLWMWVYK